MPSESKLNSFVLDLSFIFAAQSVTHRCNSMRIRFFLSSSFCFLEVLFYSGYVFLLRSINTTLFASLENQASSFWSAGNIHINTGASHELYSLTNNLMTEPSIMLEQGPPLVLPSIYHPVHFLSLQLPPHTSYPRSHPRAQNCPYPRVCHTHPITPSSYAA